MTISCRFCYLKMKSAMKNVFNYSNLNLRFHFPMLQKMTTGKRQPQIQFSMNILKLLYFLILNSLTPRQLKFRFASSHAEHLRGSACCFRSNFTGTTEGTLQFHDIQRFCNAHEHRLIISFHTHRFSAPRPSCKIHPYWMNSNIRSQTTPPRHTDKLVR